MARHQVVIIGAGFGGLNAAKKLKRADVDVTVIDRTNHHLFQPLLYQVATSGLSPADIASPIRHILRRQHNATVLLDTIKAIDTERRVVIGEHTETPYDTLIVATGAKYHYFGNDHWAEHAPGLKTLDDATLIRTRILESFERVERGDDVPLTFVVVGGGPTGLEMAGTIADMTRNTLNREFRSIAPDKSRVVLVEAADRVLQPYPEELSTSAKRQLEQLGVEVRLGWRVDDIGQTAIKVTNGETTETIETAVTVWAAGVKATDLLQSLGPAGATFDRMGRVEVLPDLTIPGHSEIFVIGDAAAVQYADGEVPGTCPAAIQMGQYVAGVIKDRLGGTTTESFEFTDKGMLATIGRSAAVADIGKLHFSGWPAWVAWLAIHIFFLIGFENRLLVLVQWAGNYITRNRSARLIR